MPTARGQKEPHWWLNHLRSVGQMRPQRGSSRRAPRSDLKTPSTAQPGLPSPLCPSLVQVLPQAQALTPPQGVCLLPRLPLWGRPKVSLSRNFGGTESFPPVESKFWCLPWKSSHLHVILGIRHILAKVAFVRVAASAPRAPETPFAGRTDLEKYYAD